MSPQFLTVGMVSVAIGCGLLPHHVHRLCSRGLVPHLKVGRLRLVDAADLDVVRRVAEEKGYLKAGQSLTCTAPA